MFNSPSNLALLYIFSIELIKIKLNVNSAWYYGKHKEVDSDDLDYDDLAVHIEFTHPIQ